MRALNRLKWLQAFEATARHGSFKGAAEELGVTPAAVGQLVRSLEEWIGHPLLSRTRSGSQRLTPVPEAQEALGDITEGFDRLESGLKKLRGRKARAIVVITASQVLLMNWLMPFLNDFSEQHDNVDLRLDVAEKLIDLAHGEADIGIRCGPGNWSGLECTWLMDEEMVMVCNPSLLPTHAAPDASWLCQQKLIHDDTPVPGAGVPNWQEVAQKIGVGKLQQTGLHINSTSAVILAALSGRGVALVRKALVSNALESGQLVRLFPEWQWPISWSYYLVSTAASLRRPEVRLFHDWMKATLCPESTN
ncbi:LysR family transcriptional regulator [Salmonella enterica subsp. enterica serovar Choleraesuis]|nr:LysR family transcriptional regulator [Salmonella enterica subsp. enterica serovar Choleraesuis]